MSTPIPTPPAAPNPAASKAQRAGQPAPCSQTRLPVPSGLIRPLGPPTPAGPNGPPLSPQGQSSADQGTLDLSVHCPFYDVTLKKMFSNPKLYAQAFPHFWEAGQFRAEKYDLSIFTPTTLHPEFKPKHLPTYAQAGGPS